MPQRRRRTVKHAPQIQTRLRHQTMGLKVNSFVVFRGYWGSCALILRLHHALCPGKEWQLRIHHDETINASPYTPVLNDLQDMGLVKLVFVNEPVLKTRAMLWRMLPVWDSEVGFVFCKDMDSVMTPRERKCMEHFMHESHRCAMGINDNPAHSLAMMGGLVGFNCPNFIEVTGIRSYSEFLSLGRFSDSQWERHGTDQILLNDAILPRVNRCFNLYRIYPNAGRLDSNHCIFDVPSITLPGVNPEYVAKGNSTSGYVGACGGAGGISYIHGFVLEYGNQEFNKIIEDLENKHNLQPFKRD